MEKKEILLPNKRFKKADNEELNLKLNLETNESLMRIGDRDVVLDLVELYDSERNRSNKYKIYGKIKMIFRNMFSGTTTYPYLEQRLYLSGDGTDNNFTGYLPYDEFAFLRKDIYRQIYAPDKGSTLGVEYNPIINYDGSTEHTTITSMSAPYHNWNIYLTYVYGSDNDYEINYTLSNGINYSFKSGNGIPFRVEDENSFYKLTSPIPHGISQGEFITLSGGTINGNTNQKENTFYVDSVGDEVYDSENFVIKLLKSQFTSTQTLSGVVLGKRCLDRNNIENTISQYYVHKHKTLTDIGDYIMDNVGFESPIFEDERKILVENSNGDNNVIVERNRMESILFDFKEPFILSGITNNLGFTPTDVYVSTIFRNGNGLFNYPPKIGYKFNFHNTWVDKQFNGTKSLETNLSGATFYRNNISFISGDTLPIGSVLIGAFVEYNKKEIKERIISESYHKITNPISIFDYGQNKHQYEPIFPTVTPSISVTPTVTPTVTPSKTLPLSYRAIKISNPQGSEVGACSLVNGLTKYISNSWTVTSGLVIFDNPALTIRTYYTNPGGYSLIIDGNLRHVVTFDNSGTISTVSDCIQLPNQSPSISLTPSRTLTPTPSASSVPQNTNPIGLYYQPHYRIKLRQLSPYFETAKTNDINNLPENTVYDDDEKLWRWRDIYSHGYIDPDKFGTNFPYVNDIHYVKTDINFYLRNERFYTNKQDGLIDFNKKFKNNKFKC